MSNFKTYPTFKLGQQVEWTSQANGCTRTKRGTIVRVIGSGQPFNAREFPGLQKGAPTGLPRQHESYIVHVPTKTGLGKGRHYWPLVSQLRLVGASSDEQTITHPSVATA